VEDDEDVAIAPISQAVPMPQIVFGETVKIMRPKK